MRQTVKRTEAEQAELERLIGEQRYDDTHIVHPPRDAPYGSVPLDKITRASNGDNMMSIANLFGIDEEGELVSFFRPSRGDILNGSALYHGTLDGYTNRGCRCARCRRANANFCASKRKNRIESGCPSHAHGLNGYTNYGCRCEVCVHAHNEYNRERYERLNGPLAEQVCPGCDEPFMPFRRGITYCSERCSDRMRRLRRKEREMAMAA